MACLTGRAGRKNAPLLALSRTFQPRQGRIRDSCRGNKGTHLWLRTKNQTQAVTGITRNHTLLRASYKTAMYGGTPQVHGRRRLHVVSQNIALRIRFSKHPQDSLEGEEPWLGTADMILVGVHSQ